MKDFKRITAFVLTLVLVMSSFAFAATDSAIVLADPVATIVSPIENSIISSDSFLVSVKLNKAATIKVSLYEEMIEKTEVVTTYVSGAAVTSAAVSYNPVDITTFEAIDFNSKASYTDVLYTTPASYTSTENIGFYSSTIENLEPGLYKLVVELVEDKVVTGAKIEKPAESKDAAEKQESDALVKYICVKPKHETEQVYTQPKEKSGALTIISNFLKSLFK